MNLINPLLYATPAQFSVLLTEQFKRSILDQQLGPSLPSGSSNDRECGSNFTHGDAEGGAEAHTWMSPPEVLYMLDTHKINRILKKQTNNTVGIKTLPSK